MDTELEILYSESVTSEKDRIVSYDSLVSNDGELSQEVIFHTNNVVVLTTLYLGRKTKGDVKAYVPLIFEVSEPPENEDLINLVNGAPRFFTTLSSII